jgi:hypothetical protein
MGYTIQAKDMDTKGGLDGKRSASEEIFDVCSAREDNNDGEFENGHG